MPFLFLYLLHSLEFLIAEIVSFKQLEYFNKLRLNVTHICRMTLLLCQLTRQGTINFLSLHFQLKCHQIRIKHVTQLLSLPDLPLSRVQGVKVVEQLSTNMKWDLSSIFFISFTVPKLPSSVGSKSFCSSPVLSLSLLSSQFCSKRWRSTRPTTPQRKPIN